MDRERRTHEIFAGATFNDSPDPSTLPAPNIPEGYVVQKKKEKEKPKKPKKGGPKNK
ncbi:uncharacterized protein NEMAJ01_1009 [Nematocida major]|uniref:uncharacterized protein n=1 Tax=Nematocida major TaxID=1912982 RepID=UPI002007D5B4|nr:uncharacterized protein NEMAJ01_1009 [Nematocida major]KAH9386113.1 hypothetical protein NEMAJ01_1009 [Nematocida major]